MYRSPRPGRAGADGRARSTVVAAVLTAALATLAACSSGDDEASPTVPTFTFQTDDTTTTTTTAAPASTSEPANDTVTTSEPASETTSAPAATTSTTVPETTTTTEPLSVQELVLRGDGIGSALFGAAPDGVIDYVTSILGGNTGDTGWVDPFAFAACNGTVARRVDWGVLSLLFTDESEFAIGREHFMGWEYGRVGQIGDEPAGLRTPGGVTLGSRVVDLLAEFPDASINEGDEDVAFPDNFYVSDVFYGLLTGTQPDDIVTVLFGGSGCGE
jgi:hypothetical protein